MNHDLFAASATATWIECSWSALNGVPDEVKPKKTLEAAARGTGLHDDMEAGEITDVEAFVVQLEPGAEYREERVKITDNCGGTLDILRDSSRIVTLIDGKFGKWDVDAFENKQMLTYAAAWLTRTNAEWFRLVIFQPYGLNDDEPFKQWIAHRSEVEAHRARVLRAVADRSPPKPGPWCRWCKAFQQCPAMSTDAGFVMGAMSRRPEELSPDELARLLRIIRALGDVKPVYEEVLTTRLKMGYTAEGVVLKPGRAWRAWNDDQQAATILMQHFGPRGVKPVTPAQAEKLGLEGKKYAAIGAHKPQGELKASY